ncbi:MAG TPA: hypothetical protein VME68_00420 [Acidobacteriaceae bacterium]|nr:hypothetical protein [Acidobacteriaceae bacterium]
MGKMNFRRWLLAGLVTGVVMDILGFFIDGMWLKGAWQAGMQRLGVSGFAPSVWEWSNVLGVVNGLLAMWVYCSIRPRFGAGLNTAFKAAVVVWAIGSLIPNVVFMVFGGLFSHQLAAYTTLGAFIQIVVGVIAGAATYKEEPAAAATPAPVVSKAVS